MNLDKTTKKINSQIARTEVKGLVDLRIAYREALEDIRDDIRKIYDKYAKNGALTYAEMTKYNRLSNLEKQVMNVMNSLFRNSDRITERVQAVSYEEAFYKHTWALSMVAEYKIKFGLLRTDDVRAAINNPLKKIAQGRLRTEGRTKIRRAITQGLIRGDSYAGMSKAIKDAINGSYYDAERIIRTEAGKAQTLGTLKSYENARAEGVEAAQVWDATLDSKTRPDHASLDGDKAQRHGGEWMFSTSVGWVKGPHLSGVASFDIRCRCALRPVIQGYDPEVRRIRDEGVVPYTNFKDWAITNNITANRFGQKYDFVKG